MRARSTFRASRCCIRRSERSSWRCWGLQFCQHRARGSRRHFPADVYPFFSRQIGLLAGQEVPIIAGVKLTGTAGRTDVGILGVRTGDLAIVDEKDLFVGRVKRNLFRQSYLGGIFTAGDPARGQSGQTYSADMRLATSRFLGRSRNLALNAYGVQSVNPGRSDKDWSYGLSAHYPNDVINAQVVLPTSDSSGRLSATTLVRRTS